MRRATLALAVSQVVSWGVLFYGFAVVAPHVSSDTGWPEPLVAGAFTVGVLVSGLAAPLVARALAEHDPRRVLAVGSVLGAVGMLGFAAASHPAVLYLSWAVIGAAMAATLYEPAMAVLVAVDATRSTRTLTAVAVAGGVASTIFAPLMAWLAQSLGWRQAIVVLALSGGAVTTLLHAVVLPPSHAHRIETRAVPEPAPPFDRPLRLLRMALLFEQAAIIATTTHLVGLLADRAVALSTAAMLLGVIGIGKVAGRLLMLGANRRRLINLAIAANLLQFVGLALPLAVTATVLLVAAMAAVGAASGATTVVRPLLVIEFVGAGPFAATSAGLQRVTTVARAAAPFALATGVAAVGWSFAWGAAVTLYAIAATCYVILRAWTIRRTEVALPGRSGRDPQPVASEPDHAPPGNPQADRLPGRGT